MTGTGRSLIKPNQVLSTCTVAPPTHPHNVPRLLLLLTIERGMQNVTSINYLLVDKWSSGHLKLHRFLPRKVLFSSAQLSKNPCHGLSIIYWWKGIKVEVWTVSVSPSVSVMTWPLNLDIILNDVKNTFKVLGSLLLTLADIKNTWH